MKNTTVCPYLAIAAHSPALLTESKDFKGMKSSGPLPKLYTVEAQEDGEWLRRHSNTPAKRK